MAMVLVHGGGFAGSCWDRTVACLSEPAVGLDLPGRGARPADLSAVTVADFVDVVVEEVERLGSDDVLLVGHSMAGLTLPRVVGRVGDRLRGVVFVSCDVPPQGSSLMSTLDPSIQEMAGVAPKEEVTGVLDADIARAIFCNDMDEKLTAYTLSIMTPESRSVLFELSDVSGLTEPVPRTWVRLGRDAIITPEMQDEMIATIGGAQVLDLDSGHMAMISRPAELAALLSAV